MKLASILGELKTQDGHKIKLPKQTNKQNKPKNLQLKIIFAMTN